jgi:hypothetical protein
MAIVIGAISMASAVNAETRPASISWRRILEKMKREAR